jgi:signal transduction histidine kinase
MAHHDRKTMTTSIRLHQLDRCSVSAATQLPSPNCVDCMASVQRELEAVAALDSVHVHIALLDAQGRVQSVNRAWKQFGLANGATPKQVDMLGMSYLDACGAAHPAEGDTLASRARIGVSEVLAGRLGHFELEYPCHSATRQRWFLMRVTPLLGPRGGAVVTHDDITQRWLLEQQRADLIADLQAANRQLSEFAHVVSHDLKAPLRSISSLASWLITDYADKLGEDGREQLGLIASRVKRLSGLIDAILAYSRAGRSQDRRVSVDLGDLVRNTIDLLTPPPHVQIEIVTPLPALEIEAVKMQQVFQNLLSNAIDFMDKPAGRVSVACLREPPNWHFTVADTGPGIEVRHFERIFKLFQTLATRDQVERTGVGLALVKKIVEIEGGKVWVESRMGIGTTFHFTLPIVRPEEGEPQSEESAP